MNKLLELRRIKLFKVMRSLKLIKYLKMKIFCGNTGTIALAKESRFHKRTKHIKRHFNSICDQVKEGDIEFCKIHTDLIVADPSTKPLS